MDQDRWKTVNRIFHSALDVPPSERHAFVLSASNGDPELEAEVKLLLKADQEAGSYLETPLLPGELSSSSAPPVSPGDVLCGRFRILRAVGEGGMGHVFEAYDSELAVHVALKVIRPEIASNPEVLGRFRQEVRLARRITHPNVCRTFDIEREVRTVGSGGETKQELVFLTMEFLQGETLDARIKRSGPLPLAEAHHVAKQLADAMAAHPPAHKLCPTPCRSCQLRIRPRSAPNWLCEGTSRCGNGERLGRESLPQQRCNRRLNGVFRALERGKSFENARA
jgi:hypothetical protein